MSDLAKIYSSNIEHNFSIIENKNAQLQLCSSSKVPEILNEIENLIKETEKILKNYENETYLLKESRGKEFKDTVGKFKRKLKKEKEALKKSEQSKQENNGFEKLLHSHSEEEITLSSYSKLQRATSATIEMENMSNNILGDLDSQTEQMKGVNTKISNVSNELSSSSSLIGDMLSINSRNKNIIIGMMITLFLILIIILVCKILL